MKRWRARLHRHGIKLNRDGPDDRLRSVRFADDIIIYANSLTELTQMIDILCDELRTAGLEFNAKKSRIFTLDEGNARREAPFFVDVAADFVEVLRGRESHKYLGNAFPGDLRQRGHTMLSNRLRCAWAKFSLFRHSLLNRHVDIKLRLRLFESVV